MGAVEAALEHAGNQKLAAVEHSVTDRAIPFIFSGQAIQAAPYMHEAVFAPGNGRKGKGFNQIALVQFIGTDGANLGIAGACQSCFLQFCMALAAGGGFGARPKEQAVAKP